MYPSFSRPVRQDAATQTVAVYDDEVKWRMCGEAQLKTRTLWVGCSQPKCNFWVHARCLHIRTKSQRALSRIEWFCPQHLRWRKWRCSKLSTCKRSSYIDSFAITWPSLTVPEMGIQTLQFKCGFFFVLPILWFFWLAKINTVTYVTNTSIILLEHRGESRCL